MPWEFVPGRTDKRVAVVMDHRGNGVQATDGDEADQEHQEKVEDVSLEGADSVVA